MQQHCLDRKAKGEKFPAHSVHDIDGVEDILEVEKESGSKKTVDFGICNEENMPACTCKDWLRFHMPCKHLAVFQHRANWQWEQLPQSYLHSAYLSTDSDALAKHFDTSSTAEVLEQQTHSPGEVTIRDNPPAQVPALPFSKRRSHVLYTLEKSRGSTYVSCLYEYVDEKVSIPHS